MQVLSAEFRLVLNLGQCRRIAACRDTSANRNFKTARYLITPDFQLCRSVRPPEVIELILASARLTISAGS
jgi:hypothetical protein